MDSRDASKVIAGLTDIRRSIEELTKTVKKQAPVSYTVQNPVAYATINRVPVAIDTTDPVIDGSAKIVVNADNSVQIQIDIDASDKKLLFDSFDLLGLSKFQLSVIE